VKIVHRDFPLAMHPMAKPFAMAVECAHDQGNDKAQGMYDTIFANQETVAPTAALIPEWAKTVSGLNFDTWKSCFDANKHADEIDADLKDGSAAGVSGTPSFWILGPNNQSKQIKGAQPIAAFSAAIDEMLK
jgi:protein-disulfide isomerase